ncbi:hypothetical protein L195_g004617 [Trifolium pratense]|uniref:Uncharacterized protein n=1 Tax=Trifolium pratense TaxID=57577 RepID=A0A2K3NYI6_TRIPR|nr:hypothetical protein L195_g004617 [Trifolium pratense]
MRSQTMKVELPIHKNVGFTLEETVVLMWSLEKLCVCQWRYGMVGWRILVPNAVADFGGREITFVSVLGAAIREQQAAAPSSKSPS